MAKLESLTELKRQLALADMQRAAVLKKLRANSEYVLTYLKERALLIVGNFYQTQNTELVYSVNNVEVKMITEKTVEVKKTNVQTKSFTGKPIPSVKTNVIKCNDYAVVLNITKYNRNGTSEEDQYVLSSAEMPSDVDKWLTIGNAKINDEDAKVFINMALEVEIKRHEAAIKEIKAKLKK